ncbi:MAG: hypothetical protein OER86_10100, partial [Phycisphaerae bacterium]|nr:hypothetical protein [Phycisphaerae bacterium]
MLPLVALGLVGVLAWATWGKLRDEVWAYFTDDVGTRVEVQDDKVRSVLWQDPKQNVFVEKRDPKAPAAIDPVNRPGGRLEAAFSPDGTMMVVVRWQSDKLDSELGPEGAKTSADMYLSRWNGRVWSRPRPIAGINTDANERGPVLSRDGRYLLFSSDREGGRGGYDLYVARWDGLKWTGVEALGEAVNSPAHELGPALSADGSRLYFSSDRAGGSTEDIYVARRVGEPEVPAPSADGAGGEPQSPPKEGSDKKGAKGSKPSADANAVATTDAPGALPPVPVYAGAEPVNHLNSVADDVQAALTARGDHVFLASDRDRSGKGQIGFGVYLSRVVEGKVMPPEKVDLYIKQGNATDPAVRMEGFDLLFSTDIEQQADGLTAGTPEAFRLYRSTTREVIGWFDLSRWEQFKQLLSNIIWWILLAIAALIALIYLLERWQDITSLFHKCLAGSVAVHLMLLIVAMLWLIVQEFGGSEEQSPEIAISIDALAQEELALESEPDNAEIADSKVALLMDKIKSDFKIPRFKPLKPTKTAPIVRSTDKVSLVDDVRPSKANETPNQQPTPKPAIEVALLKALPETLLPDPDRPTLDESETTNEQKAITVADPSSDLFKPTKSIPQVLTKQAQEKALKTAAVKESTEAKEVQPSEQASKATDTGGDLVNPHRGLVADGSPPPIEGVGNKATTLMNLGGPDSQTDRLLPGKLETPDHDLDGKALTKLLRKQRGKPSVETIE